MIGRCALCGTLLVLHLAAETAHFCPARCEAEHVHDEVQTDLAPFSRRPVAVLTTGTRITPPSASLSVAGHASVVVA
jgi:hypothetical protein